MARVAIVGAGVMGTAMAVPLSDNGNDVRLVGTHLDEDIIRECKMRHYHPRLKRELPSGVRSYYLEEISQALEGVEIIVSGVNSLGVHWIGQTLADHLQLGQSVIAVTKGLEVNIQGKLLILPDVFRNELPGKKADQVIMAAIGGPCIAGELARRRQSNVVFGACNLKEAQRLAGVFRTSYYHVSVTDDLEGLEICAALKNAYAMGVGLAAGILERDGGVDLDGTHMHNLAAAIFAQGCVEMDRMLQIAGRSRNFAFGLPGAGDLYVTCQGGRTSRLGRLLGLGYNIGEAKQIMAGETLEAAEVIKEMDVYLSNLEQQGLDTSAQFPLMRVLADIIVRGRQPSPDFIDFF